MTRVLNERRRKAAEAARASNDLRGQIKNTPEYIVKAVAVCKFLKIDVHVSVYEADPQVLYIAILKSLIPVSGDSDLLAYGLAEEEQEDQDQDDNPSCLSELYIQLKFSKVD